MNPASAATAPRQNVTAWPLASARPSPVTTPPPGDLRAIERQYQVAEDSMISWQPRPMGVPLGRLSGTRDMTATEGRLLDRLVADRGLLGLSRFKDIADEAFAVADRRSPPPSQLPPAAEAAIARLPAGERDLARRSWPQNDGHNDAFRHAFWNARLTQAFGAEWTKAFTTAHEGSNLGSSTREAMDLYNNEVGRAIGAANPSASASETADLIRDALDDGRLVVIGANGRLAWSNTVAVGHHGVTVALDTPARIGTPAGTPSAW